MYCINFFMDGYQAKWLLVTSDQSIDLKYGNFCKFSFFCRILKYEGISDKASLCIDTRKSISSSCSTTLANTVDNDICTCLKLSHYEYQRSKRTLFTICIKISLSQGLKMVNLFRPGDNLSNFSFVINLFECLAKVFGQS